MLCCGIKRIAKAKDRLVLTGTGAKDESHFTHNAPTVPLDLSVCCSPGVKAPLGSGVAQRRRASAPFNNIKHTQACGHKLRQAQKTL